MCEYSYDLIEITLKFVQGSLINGQLFNSSSPSAAYMRQ